MLFVFDEDRCLCDKFLLFGTAFWVILYFILLTNNMSVHTFAVIYKERVFYSCLVRFVARGSSFFHFEGFSKWSCISLLRWNVSFRRENLSEIFNDHATKLSWLWLLLQEIFSIILTKWVLTSVLLLSKNIGMEEYYSGGILEALKLWNN